MSEVCAVRGVRKTFEAELAPVRALRGVDLDLQAGEFVAIMGPSGCGKSTLLNLIAGLDTADEGEITLAGERVTGRSEDDLAHLRRRHIGIVFQFFNLLEGMTVLENVVLPAVIAGTKRRAAETRARRTDGRARHRWRARSARALQASPRRRPDHPHGHPQRRGRRRGQPDRANA
jgi:putative ABC transport system ATP-binding protein